MDAGPIAAGGRFERTLRGSVGIVVALLCALFAVIRPSAAVAEQPIFGFNEDWLVTHQPAQYGTALQAERAIVPSGLPAVLRLPLTWNSVEPSQGQRNWAKMDGIRDAARARGVKLLPAIDDAPDWATGTNGCASDTTCPPGDNPDDLAAWRGFLHDLVDRYEEDLAGVEIWNEPNTILEWATTHRPNGALPGGPDPLLFSEVFCAGLEGVREANTSLPVVLGGLNDPGAVPNQQVPAADFLDQVYEAPAATHPPNPDWPNPDPYPDIRTCAGGSWSIGVHPYSFQGVPDQPNHGYLGTLGRVRAARDDHQDADRHLWISEFGYYGGGLGINGFHPWPDADIGVWLPCAYRMAVPGGAAAPGGDVDAFIVHRLIDTGLPSPIVSDWTTAQRNWGVWRQQLAGPLQPKPQAANLATMLSSGPVSPAAHC